MSDSTPKQPREGMREGNLQAPTRHNIDWQSEAYYDEHSVMEEMERVFDLCHGCRRCVSLCNSFPTLFDLVDNSETLEMDGVAKDDYWKVVDECYLCDLCFMTKCPYTPPHEWNIDFPHLMLRAKAVKYKEHGANFRDKVLTSTDMLGKVLARPVISTAANTANKVGVFRKALDATVGVHHNAWLPPFASKPLRSRHKGKVGRSGSGDAAGATNGKVAIFATCYGNYNEPIVGDDLIAVLEHNGIAVSFAQREVCCGMPKLELGDLDTVKRLKETNIPQLARLVDEGWDLMAPVPSCVLMFRQELPLMFPEDADVKKVKAAFFDPFEYLMLRHKEGKLKTDFKAGLGVVSYQAACHQRVQNFGRKTMEVLSLIPETQVKIIERCSGHDGTYAIKSERRAAAEKIVRPVAQRVQQDGADYYGSDCPMAGHHIENALGNKTPVTHPISLMRKAYGI